MPLELLRARISSVALAGVGINLVQPPLTTLFLSTVPTRYAGSASGIWTTGQQFGGAVGVASLSAIFFGVAASDGYRSALTACALTIIAALVVSAALCFALPSPEPSPEAAG